MEAALSGPTGRTVIESAIFTIGSSPDNSLVLNDVKVSAQYAQAPNRSSDEAAANSAAMPTLANIDPSHSAYGVVLPLPPVPPGSQPPPGTNPAYASPQANTPPPQFQHQVYMPQYAQQPYIPPGYPGFYPGYPGSMPGYAPPAQPARRATRRTLWIIVSVLLIVGVVGGAAYIFFTRSTPDKTSSAFCDALL